MNTPPLPNQPDPNADPDGWFGHIPKGLNPWRSWTAYLALGSTVLGLAVTPVAFIGGLGALLALFGIMVGAQVQSTAMTEPQAASPPGRTLLRLFAMFCVFTIVILGFMAVATQGSAMLAASRGKPSGTGGSIPGLIMLSLGVSIVLARLASVSRKADMMQTVPLMLYWMCYVPLATLLVSGFSDGRGFSN